MEYKAPFFITCGKNALERSANTRPDGQLAQCVCSHWWSLFDWTAFSTRTHAHSDSVKGSGEKEELRGREMLQRVDDDVDSEGNSRHGGFILATQDAGISPKKRLAATKTWREMLSNVVQNKHHYLLVHLFGRLTRTIENNKSGPARHWTDHFIATMHLQLFANNRNSCSLFVVWYVWKTVCETWLIGPRFCLVWHLSHLFLCQTVAEHSWLWLLYTMYFVLKGMQTHIDHSFSLLRSKL